MRRILLLLLLIQFHSTIIAGLAQSGSPNSSVIRVVRYDSFGGASKTVNLNRAMCDTVTGLNEYMHDSVSWIMSNMPVAGRGVLEAPNMSLYADTSWNSPTMPRRESDSTAAVFLGIINGKLNISDTTGKWEYRGNKVTTLSGANNITYPTSLATLAAINTAVTGLATTSSLAAYATTVSLGSYLTTSTAASTYQPIGSYLTSINSSMVTTALGFTPVSQSGARSAITLTTTGSSGAATYNSTTGVLNVPTPSASGTVTSVGLSSSDLNISGSPITTSGTMTASLTTTGVTAGTYGSSTAIPVITVDNKGRATALSTASVTVTLPNVGTSGTYGQVGTDAQGRVTSGKRQEYYSGSTNGSGVYAVTYGTAYSATPIVNPVFGLGATNKYTIVLTASTTTGFSLLVQNRTDVVGLLPAYAPVSGQAVDVTVFEK